MTALRLSNSFNLQKALMLSLFLHMILLGLHFTSKRNNVPHKAPLEVILVNAKSQKTPTNANALAQVALDGGGQADKGRATTLPAQANDEITQRELNASQQRLETLETLQRELSGQGIQFERNTNARSTNNSDKQGSDERQQRALEMQRLQAQISDNIKTYNERPRKHFFSPRTSPYAFAMYEEAWRHKVEQVGNANYPDELKGRIYGKLRLTAYIRADGSLEDVEIDRSSGSAVLDRAAVRILRLSAPFSTFSSDMRKQIDVLAITRTWVFSQDKVSTEQ